MDTKNPAKSTLQLGRIVLGASLVALASGCTFSSTSCVSQGTIVLGPDGPRRIEDLRVGDALYAVDPRTGEFVATTIVALRSARRECVELEFGGGKVLRCTPEHPLFDPDRGDYGPASDWVDGKRTRLFRLTTGGHVRAEVTACLNYVGLFTVFDVTVASDLHNFIAGDVLVHNKSYCAEPCGETTSSSGTGATETGSTTGSDSESGSSGTVATDGSSDDAATDEGMTETDSGSDSGAQTDTGSTGTASSSGESDSSGPSTSG